MVRVRNVFLNYKDGGETSFLFMGRGRNVFPKYELRAKRLTRKWCKLTMGRKVRVPTMTTIADTERLQIEHIAHILKIDIKCKQIHFGATGIINAKYNLPFILLFST